LEVIQDIPPPRPPARPLRACRGKGTAGVAGRASRDPCGGARVSGNQIPLIAPIPPAAVTRLHPRRLTRRVRSFYVLGMGGKDPNRQPRVGSVRETPPGWLRLLTCNTCAHRGVLPAERLIRKHGELALLEFALVGVRCTDCRSRGATMTMVRLCEAGCPRRR
jgi:hypothetical protein